MEQGWHDRELSKLSSEEKILIIRRLQQEVSKLRQPDMTMLLAWESGWEEAIEKAAEIAESMNDEYNRDDPYCQGICDTAAGIAWRIRELKK
jgi:hypothetical protein